MNDKYSEDKKTNQDHVATPRWVVENVYSIIHIEQFKNIWFPFNHYDSEFKLKADELNLKYKATHIFDDLGNDFFSTIPPENCELLISNPPFSLQNKIIQRSFELVDSKLIKAFCLLLPLTTLETQTRAAIYEKYSDKLAILIFRDRIKFIGHDHSYPKPCCWICYNISCLDKKIYWI